VTTTNTAPEHDIRDHRGRFSGIGAAIKLDQAGLADFVILEDGAGVGGAWHWNTYPGVGVDIPSFSYQFSFDNPFGLVTGVRPGCRAEVRYAEQCTDRYRTARAAPAEHRGHLGGVRRRRGPVAAGAPQAAAS